MTISHTEMIQPRPIRRHSRAIALAACTSLLAACSAAVDDPPAAPGPTTVDIPVGAYLPSDGLLVIELESGSASGDWSEETALTGFTGTSYLRWNGPNLFNAPGQDTFGFDIWVDDPGVYQFRIHNRHDDPNSTMSNDVFVRMDGGDWVKVFSSVRGAWTWASRHEFSPTNKPEAEYTLAGGIHRIEFSGRSFDFSIDRLHLYDTGVQNPLDTAHPESSRSGMSGTPPAPPDALHPRRRLVLGPVVARRAHPADPTAARAGDWNRALLRGRSGGIARPVDIAIIGRHPDWSDELDPLVIAPGLARLLRDLPGRWQGHGDLRWTFECSPWVVPAALDDLARLVRASDPEARPLVLRLTPDDLLARWPDVVHSSFDRIVLLRSVRDGADVLEAALALLEHSGRAFEVDVQVGEDRTEEP